MATVLILSRGVVACHTLVAMRTSNVIIFLLLVAECFRKSFDVSSIQTRYLSIYILECTFCFLLVVKQYESDVVS
jgi:hypothetical protein